MKLSIQLGKKDNSANQCLITDIDDEYEDDKKLIELLSDNCKWLIEIIIYYYLIDIKKENKKGNDVLIQSLSQKKKKDLKREMIPEVNESKCKTKKVSVIDSEILINNDTLIIDNDSFIENKLKQKGYWKKTLSPILHLPSLTTEQVIPIAKTNRKVLIDAFNKVKDKEGKNNTPISSNVQTESNSSQSNRSNSSIAKRISPESSNTNIKEQQLLAQDIDQLIYEINEYKDDPIIKEKLEMIMMNIAEIKTAFMTRDKNRSNLVSAPSSSVKKNSLTQKECLPLLQENTKGKKERIEEIKRHYLKDNFKVVNMSQRRRHVTAPIKLFHMKN